MSSGFEPDGGDWTIHLSDEEKASDDCVVAMCNSVAFRAKVQGYKKKVQSTTMVDGVPVTYICTITYDRFGTEIDRTAPILEKEK